MFATALFLLLAFLSPFAEAGEWRTEKIADLEVHLYVPDTPPKLAGKRALMVSLHGCRQSHSDLKRGGNWQDTAEEYGMIVALPRVPNGGFMGCWDYYGANHTRTTRHDKYLIALVQALIETEDIDPAQVYLTGLSSGGGETLILGCLAPDLFAGIGAAAGPSVGTSSIGSVATTQNDAVSLCRKLAGDEVEALQTQLVSVVYGTSDYTVAQGYSTLNAEVAAELFKARADEATSVIAGQGTERLWRDEAGPRVSLLRVAGMRHAWPAGAGPGGAYIDSRHVDYPAYVTAFFFKHNRRVQPK